MISVTAWKIGTRNHEPFGEPWYHGDEARCPRPVPDEKRKPGLPYASVWARILEASEKKPVFSKDMPHHTEHLWEDSFFDAINHSFLIRDPAKVLASLQRSYEKAGMTDVFEANEVSFEAQRRLFGILAERNGRPPVAIDSDDLLSDPPRMVAAYCQAIDIPFIAEALSWEPGSRSDVLWYDSNDSIWHASLRASNGLKAQSPKPADVSKLPQMLQEQYEMFLPHYQYLYRYRI